jgi:hypothetical protein
MRGVASLAAALSFGLCGCASGAASATQRADAAPDADTQAQDASAQADSAARAPSALVHSALWERVAAGDDPFGDAMPTPCAAGAFGEENLGGELVFFVRTELCSWLTVEQASRSEVRAGDTLKIHLYHFPLTAPEGTRAQLRVQMGDALVWQRDLEIPGPAAELEEEWEASESYPVGTPVLFHVHNHGSNEYTLIGIEVL